MSNGTTPEQNGFLFDFQSRIQSDSPNDVVTECEKRGSNLGVATTRSSRNDVANDAQLQALFKEAELFERSREVLSSLVRRCTGSFRNRV
jgi:hypothetical protein